MYEKATTSYIFTNDAIILEARIDKCETQLSNTILLVQDNSQ